MTLDAGNADHPEYGIYYNWYTATGTYGGRNTTDTVSYSICPKGWRLPRSDGSSSDVSANEFYGLASKYVGSAAMRSIDGTVGPEFVLSGIWADNGIAEQGNSGRYWSNTPLKDIYWDTHVLYIRTSSVYMENYYLRHRGLSVRCVAEDDFWTINSMQEMTPAIVNSVSTPSASATREAYSRTEYESVANKSTIVPVRTLTDTRDGKTYQVKKLADGSIWMTENLKLSDQEISAYDSNLPAGTSYTVPASYNGSWCEDVTEACINEEIIYNTDNASHPEYGTYYSWSTATAGYGRYSTTIQTAYSICPKGWHLPSGGSTGEYQSLIDAGYNTFELMGKTVGGPAVVLAGHHGKVGTVAEGSVTFNWTSTPAHTNTGKGFTIRNTEVTTSVDYYKYRGLTIRCVADEFWNIASMQQMNATLANSIDPPAASAASDVATKAAYDALANKSTAAATRTLIDSRDGKTYQVKKLADGNVWMTQNLRLAGPFTPDKTDSDVTWNSSDSGAFQLAASNTGTWCTTQDATCYNQSMSEDSNNTDYGVYYNWYAATAGTGKYASPAAGTAAASSVCPKSWRLPIGSPSGEFQALYSKYNSNALMRKISGGPAITMTGRRLSTGTSGQTTYGELWSSTPSSQIHAYELHVENSNDMPNDVHSKWIGIPIRCLVK